VKERVEQRVLGAIRWTDAVTQSVIAHPLRVRSAKASFTRNLSGLSVIIAATGLEKYTETFVLPTPPAADVEPAVPIDLEGTVEDPSGRYLPRAFNVKLPRRATKDVADSLFVPIDLQLLPTPQAKIPAGWAQVRVTVKKATGEDFPNVLVRVVAKADNRVLGHGMSDARGDALVGIPGLPLFQPSAADDEIVTSETAAGVEFVPPDSSEEVVDWTALDKKTAKPVPFGSPLALKAGGTYSLKFSVTT
jgi:hypothetical protein